MAIWKSSRVRYVSSSVLSLLLTVPASAGLIFLAQPIVSIIFEHGRFSAHDTLMTAQALSLYSVGLFAYASLKIIVPVFYALNRTRYPVIGSFLTVLLNIIFVLMLLEPLQHCAIALSTSLCVLINFLFLSVALYREVNGYRVFYLLQCFFKIVLISAIMGVGAQWLNKAVMAQCPLICWVNYAPLPLQCWERIIFYFTSIYSQANSMRPSPAMHRL